MTTLRLGMLSKHETGLASILFNGGFIVIMTTDFNLEELLAFSQESSAIKVLSKSIDREEENMTNHLSV